AFQEVKAVEAGDKKAFDAAFWGHVGHIVRNACRSIVLSWTRGYVALAPSGVHRKTKHYYRRLQWASASFAIMSDIAMGALGGSLKIKEKITGRFADILAHMFIGTAILRRFEAEGQREADLPFVHYGLKYCLANIQTGFDGIFDNLRVPGLRWFFKGWIGAWSRINSLGSQASDGWLHAISSKMLEDGDVRERLTEGIYIPKDLPEQIARLEIAFKAVHQAEAAEKKVKKAIRSGALPKKKVILLLDEAKSKNIITEEE